MSVLSFFVDGIPVPKGRPRLGKGGRVFTPSRTAEWEALVRLTALSACLAVRWTPQKSDVYEVSLVVNRARKSGDVDNHAKSIMDALNTVAFCDDSQVMALSVRLNDGSEPGAWIQVERTK